MISRRPARHRRYDPPMSRPAIRPLSAGESARLGRRAVLRAAAIVVLLHTLVAIWVWNSWGQFGRDTILVWMDFPASLVYLDRADATFLAGSLLLGGLQWSLVAALLTWILGRSARG
jgi:hypothetical protein